MEERGEVECSIHRGISQWSVRNRTAPSASSLSEFHREIQHSKTLVIYVSLYSSVTEKQGHPSVEQMSTQPLDMHKLPLYIAIQSPSPHRVREAPRTGSGLLSSGQPRDNSS